eukprot:956692-Alexandrium_andersonii.AAC.1
MGGTAGAGRARGRAGSPGMRPEGELEAHGPGTTTRARRPPEPSRVRHVWPRGTWGALRGGPE